MRQREPNKKIMPGANNLPTTVEMNIWQHYLTIGAKCFSDSTTIDCFSLSSFFSIFSCYCSCSCSISFCSHPPNTSWTLIKNRYQSGPNEVWALNIKGFNTPKALNIKHYVAMINQEFIVLSYDPEDFMHDNLTEPSLMKYTHFTFCSWSYLQICLMLYDV